MALYWRLFVAFLQTRSVLNWYCTSFSAIDFDVTLIRFSDSLGLARDRVVIWTIQSVEKLDAVGA